MQQVKLRFGKSANDYRTKEAYKTLRTNVEFCGGNVKVIAITSCTPNEGKSSIAMEMTRAFAEAGNKTILLDADMRKSVLVGRYKTGAVRNGLTHCLAGKADLQDVICETNIPNLYVAFSGPVSPNPSELLGGEQFASIIGELRESFDYIIIDTPPLGSVIDAAVTAKQCDGIVFVIENNAVSYRFAQNVKDQIDKAGARILGVVLNKVDMSVKGYYGHYGRYYGRYYGKYYGKYYGRYGEDASIEVAVAKHQRAYDDDILDAEEKENGVVKEDRGNVKNTVRKDNTVVKEGHDNIGNTGKEKVNVTKQDKESRK